MEFGAKVTGTEFLPDNSALKIEAANLKDVVFAGRSLVSFVAIGSKFESCDFRNMKISQACFGGGKQDSIYSRCIFDGSQIAAKAPGFAVFENCSFRNVLFSELNCRNIEFVDCILSGELKKGFFNGTVSAEAQILLGRGKNRFINNDLSNLKLGDVGFRSGIDLSKQTLPRDDAYIFFLDAEAALARAKKMCLALSEGERKSLSVLVRLMERDIGAGQEQLFFNTNAFPSAFKPAFDLIRRTD